MTRTKYQPGARGRQLEPVPAPPLQVEAVFDLDPNGLIESIYTGIAHDVAKSRGPLEVECGIAEWLAITTHMITSGTPDGEADDALAGFFGALIDVARRHATPRALALLRALSVLPDTPPAEAAAAAAAELAVSGVTDRAWVAQLSQLRPTSCLRYAHIDGSQESLIAGFSYGRTEHAIAVLIDHQIGGGIKDCWVTTEPEMARQQILTTLTLDPQVQVGSIGWVNTQRILNTALSRPICAADDDQISNTATNIALLRRRVHILDGKSSPSGRPLRSTPRRRSAGQDTLFADPPTPRAAKNSVA